ncbi:hypothetical protein NM208_g12552 [Fusarium decemcellulare]|uniref:Uncharacterized protein n=1 Tax=Fusarium decemcellulare TaxID=57161 RepID=A0ACC1RQ08_9HYPO|nr:hypothetical protein NM208_g12552 [Fusarium decemcellulare]
MTTGAPGHPLQAGNITTGTLHNYGISFSGNSFQGNVFLGSLNGKPSEADCKKALFLTNPVDDRGAIITAKSRLVPEVCQWILDDPSFRNFHDETGTELLWITGGPGMGKTMMSLFLLRELETNLVPQQEDTILFYFNESLFSQSSLEALWRILETMLKDEITGKVVFLIDGLDECREDSLQPLLRKICDFIESRQQQEVSRARGQCGIHVTSAASVKMVLVSRETPDCLSNQLSRFPRVRIGAITKNGPSAVGHDPTIAAQLALEGISLGQDAATSTSGDTTQITQPLVIYIKTKVAVLSQESGFDEAFQSSLRKALHEKGDGSFLWVDLAIRLLNLYAAEYAAQLVQHHLMPTVDEMYCQFLQCIPDSMIPVTAALLQWVVVARRPLIVPELAAALTQMGFAEYGSVDTTRQIVDSCGSLLSISENEMVQIAHTSIKDLLTAESGPLWWDAELFQFHINVDDVNWDVAGYYHLRSASGCAAVNLSSLFFRPGSKTRKTWWLSYYPETTNKAAWTTPRDFNLLHLAAYLNLASVAHQLEQEGQLEARLNSRDSQGETPLGLATIMGSMDMFIFLMERGASPPLASVGHDLIELACCKGRVQIVEYLLDAGWDVNSQKQDIKWRKAAGLATRFFHGVASEALSMSSSADNHWSLYTRDMGVGQTPLHHACFFGHLSVAELLLSRGANVHAETTANWTALHVAAWTGREDCVRLLIEHGADLLGATDEGWNLMHSRRAHPEAVEFLLAAGADGLINNSEGKTAAETVGILESALIEECRETLRILQTYGTPGYVPWKPKYGANA